MTEVATSDVLCIYLCQPFVSTYCTTSGGEGIGSILEITLANLDRFSLLWGYIVNIAIKGGSKGSGGRGPIQKSGSLCPPNEDHHADILTEVYAIA